MKLKRTFGEALGWGKVETNEEKTIRLENDFLKETQKENDRCRTSLSNFFDNYCNFPISWRLLKSNNHYVAQSKCQKCKKTFQLIKFIM